MSSTGTAVDVVMPQMGVSVSEGTITKWNKQVGDTIEADETLLEISTDKVDTEVPSPAAGVVTEILVQEGETVEVGTVLARIGGEGSAAAPAPEAPAPEAAPPAPEAPEAAVPAPEAPVAPTQPAADAAAASATEGPTPVEAPEQLEQTATPAGDNGRSFVSPVVARIAAEHGIDPAEVPGTGNGGRVTKKDINAFIEAQEQASTKASSEGTPAAAAPAPPAPTAAPAAAPPPVAARPSPEPAAAGTGESFEPLSAMRRGIAEHMRR